MKIPRMDDLWHLRRRSTLEMLSFPLICLCAVLVQQAHGIEDTPGLVSPSATITEQMPTSMEPSVSMDASIETSMLSTDNLAMPASDVVMTFPSSVVAGESSHLASATMGIASVDVQATTQAASASEFIVVLGPSKSTEPALTPSHDATTSPMQATATPSLDSVSTHSLGTAYMTTSNVESEMLTVIPSSDLASMETSVPVMSALPTQSLDTSVMNVDGTVDGTVATSVVGFQHSEWSSLAESGLHSEHISTPLPSQVMTSLPLEHSVFPTAASEEASSLSFTETPMPALTELYSMVSGMTTNMDDSVVPTEMYNSDIHPGTSLNTEWPSDSVIVTSPPLDFTASMDSTTIVDATQFEYSTNVPVDASSVMLISPTSSVLDIETSVLVTTEQMMENTAATVEDVYTYKAKLRLSGNCSVLKEFRDGDQLDEFENNLVIALSVQLMFPANRIRIMSPECGSIIVVVHFVNVTTKDNVEETLSELKSGDKLFAMSNESYIFSLMSVEAVPDESDRTQPPPASTKKALTNVQIIVIIVCSVVGGTLMIYALAFCVYACYQKKKTKSFDLGETPGSSLTTEDFTLTKLQRDAPAYGEYGLVAHNGRSKWPNRSNGQYQSIEDEMQCVAPDDVHLASTLPLRGQAQSSDATLPTAPANSSLAVNGNGNSNGSAPPVNVMSSNGRAGFENPSFSSDDVLDSGPDTDQELPMDTEPVRFVANQGYENDETPGNNKTGSGKSEGATAF